MPVTKANVESVFTYHPPQDGDPEKYALIRGHAKVLAAIILDQTKSCADQQAAIRHLRDCVACANAAIALDGGV